MFAFKKGQNELHFNNFIIEGKLKAQMNFSRSHTYFFSNLKTI